MLNLTEYIAGLDADSQESLEYHAERIRSSLRRTAKNIWLTGNSLTEIKGILGHGNFSHWIDDEFHGSERTAQKLMNVAKKLDFVTIADLKIAPTVLYAIAAASASVRLELLERAKSGERLKLADVKAAVARSKTSKAEALPPGFTDTIAVKIPRPDIPGFNSSYLADWETEPRPTQLPEPIDVEASGLGTASATKSPVREAFREPSIGIATGEDEDVLAKARHISAQLKAVVYQFDQVVDEAFDSGAGVEEVAEAVGLPSNIVKVARVYVKAYQKA